jgi:predicted MFS family arabinose efflux permease
MSIAVEDHRVGLTSVAAITLFAVAGSVMPVIMPGVLDALAGTWGLSGRQIALIVTTEMCGTAMGSLAVSLAASPLVRRRLGVALVSLAALGHVWAALSQNYLPLLSSRFVAGIGEGGIVALASAAIAGISTPDRVFATIIVTNMTLATLFFRFQGSMVALGGKALIFATLLALTILSGAVLPRVLSFAARTNGAVPKSGDYERPALRLARLGSPPVVALFAFLFFSMSIGTVWPLMGRIGLSLRVGPALIASALGRSTIVGLLAGLIATWLGLRVGRRIPLWVGSIGLIATLGSLTYSPRPTLFPALVASFVFWWILTLPYYLGQLASLDRIGRLAAFSIVVQSAGQTIGPAIAAWTLRQDTYFLAILESLSYCAIALVLASWADQANKSDQSADLARSN